MNGMERDDKFLHGVKKVLTESESHLDPVTLVRLRTARMKAVESISCPVPWYTSLPRWVTAGGLASAVVCVAALSFWFTMDTREAPVAQMEDMEILTTKEQLDLYKDLDFYRWLEQSDRAG